MIPKSFSATSLSVAEGCLSRFKAQVIDRGADYEGDAAGVGIVCHGTLEEFVRGVFVRKDMHYEWSVIEAIFKEQYTKQFGPNQERPEYQDARSLIYKWFWKPNRQNELASVKILSLESKHSFQMPVVINGAKTSVTVNYIIDRLEKIGDGEYRVVDYKSNRFALTPSEVGRKIQAKLYAAAVQLIYKDAHTIWVEFDFLRHEPAGIAFTLDDNRDSWLMIKRSIQRILDTPDDVAEKSETINEECVWCVKKATCKKLQSNIAVGGIKSLDSEELAQLHLEIKSRQKALETLASDVDRELLTMLVNAETIELNLERSVVTFGRRSYREITNIPAITAILGPALATRFTSGTLAELDGILETGGLTAEQKKEISKYIRQNKGNAKIKVSKK